ncbi:MAG: hypothetical protein ISS79_02245 [Phycisphaerae bacterium]|nr:hypothetical protein [Phycisphaerae bacterium]
MLRSRIQPTKSKFLARKHEPTGRQCRFAGGLTLIEAMVTMVVVVIAALGGLSYEYLTAKHTKIATSQMTATRTAQLLLEDWKSSGGSLEYQPSDIELGFSSVSSVPRGIAVPAELKNTLADAAYSIETDGLPMVVTLRHQDVDYDTITEVKLRQLAIVVAFGEVVGGELSRSASWLETIPPVTLTTFVRTDSSGG